MRPRARGRQAVRGGDDDGDGDGGDDDDAYECSSGQMLDDVRVIT